jgi:hypothetical protein
LPSRNRIVLRPRRARFFSGRCGIEITCGHGLEFHGVNKHNHQILERLSREDPAGGTPAVLGIDATLLEPLVFRRLAERLPPLAPGASYRYQISAAGARFLKARE